MIKFILTVVGLIMLYSFPVLLYGLFGALIVILLQALFKKRNNNSGSPIDKNPTPQK
jgi:hypothetical protein